MTSDAAGLRAALRDDIAAALHQADCPWPGCNHKGYEVDRENADAVLARLSDRYDLDGWLAHLARYRASGDELADTVAAVEAQRAGGATG